MPEGSKGTQKDIVYLSLPIVSFTGNFRFDIYLIRTKIS